MSKAFTRESDDAPDRPEFRRPPAALPPGTPNYITPDGAERLRADLERLVRDERPPLASLTADPEARHRLQSLNQQIHQLEETLAAVQVLPLAEASDPRVRFGMFVTVRSPDGETTRYRIVGVEETDVDQGWISCLSPLGKALLNSEPGKPIRFRFPSGEQELRILARSLR